MEKITDRLKDPGFLKKAATACAIVVILLVALSRVNSDKQDVLERGEVLAAEQTEENNSEGEDTETDEGSPAKGMIYVDIDGAVVAPGLIGLQDGSRMDDVIKAAGGLTANADTKSLNRAALVTDGEKIYVYSVEESESGVETGAPPESAGQVSGKVNINTAGTDELITLSGVGPATAGKIIDYREKNGKYKKVEDLMNVSGIGEKTFEKLRDDITV